MKTKRKSKPSLKLCYIIYTGKNNSNLHNTSLYHIVATSNKNCMRHEAPVFFNIL